MASSTTSRYFIPFLLSGNYGGKRKTNSLDSGMRRNDGVVLRSRRMREGVGGGSSLSGRNRLLGTTPRIYATRLFSRVSIPSPYPPPSKIRFRREAPVPCEFADVSERAVAVRWPISMSWFSYSTGGAKAWIADSTVLENVGVGAFFLEVVADDHDGIVFVALDVGFTLEIAPHDFQLLAERDRPVPPRAVELKTLLRQIDAMI